MLHLHATYVDDDGSVKPPGDARSWVTANLDHELGRFTFFCLDGFWKQVKHRRLHVRSFLLATLLHPGTIPPVTHFQSSPLLPPRTDWHYIQSTYSKTQSQTGNQIWIAQWHTPWPKKVSCKPLSISCQILSNFCFCFHWHILWKICNDVHVVTKYTTTP